MRKIQSLISSFLGRYSYGNKIHEKDDWCLNRTADKCIWHPKEEVNVMSI